MDLFEKAALEINELKQLKNGKLSDVGECIKNLLDEKKKLKELEIQIAASKEIIKKFENEIIPDMMNETGLPMVSTSSGETIKVKDVIQASLPSFTAIDKVRDYHKKLELIQRREEGLNWFKENGLGGIIKNEININVGKDDKQKIVIMDALSSVGVAPSVKESIHSRTLNAVIKECIQNGMDVPRDIFNVYEGKTIEIK